MVVSDQNAVIDSLPHTRPKRLEQERSLLALVRSDRRRGAVAETLGLVDSVIPKPLSEPIVLHAWMGRSRSDSVTAEAVSSVLDVLLRGTRLPITIISGAPNAFELFDSIGLHSECWGRRVRFLDLIREEQEWIPVASIQGRSLRISGTVARAQSQVLLMPLSFGRSVRSISLSTFEDLIHPTDRIWLNGPSMVRASVEVQETLDRVSASYHPCLSVAEGRQFSVRSDRRYIAMACSSPVDLSQVAAQLLPRSSVISRLSKVKPTAVMSQLELVGDVEEHCDFIAGCCPSLSLQTSQSMRQDQPNLHREAG